MNLGKLIATITSGVVILFFLTFTIVHAQDSEGGSIFSIHDILWTFVNNVFGWLFAAAGSLLNAAISDYIVGFGNTFLDEGVGAAVDTAWVIVRDIFNLTFIFGLIWIGFKMILNSDDANTRRWLVNLIMAALLVNFSLFFTKFIVDFTNLLATEIVDGGFGRLPSGTPDVSGIFMTQMGATSVWDGTWINKSPDENFMVIFGAALVFLVGAFVFLAGAIMIYIRFIALCLYMIFSPLMFLGWVFPNMQSVTSRYWSGFLGRAFFAPIYILLLYFSAAVMMTFGSLGGAASFASAFGGGSGGWEGSYESTIVPFILIVGFMIASIVAANKLGADGAGVTMNIMNGARSRVQRTVQQTTYRVMGGTAYGAGRLAAQPYEYGKRRASYALGSGLERQINRMQQSNSKALRAIARTTSVDSAARSAAQSLKNQKAGLISQQTIEEQQKASNKINERADKMAKANEALARATDKTRTEDERKAAAAAFAAELRKMSDEEVQSLPNSALKQSSMWQRLFADPTFFKEQQEAREIMAANMSDAQIKSLQESGKYTNDEIKNIKTARNNGTFNPLMEVLEKSTATDAELSDTLDELSRTIRGFSTDRLTGIKLENKPGETGVSLTDSRIAANLTDKQMDALRDSGKFTNEDFKKIEAARETGLVNIARKGSPVDASTVAAAKNPNFQNKQRQNLFSQGMAASGNLPVDVFTTPDMVPYIVPRTLEERLRNGVSAEELSRIKTNIDSYIKFMPTSTPLEVQNRDKIVKMWKQWSNSSVYGSLLDLESAK